MKKNRHSKTDKSKNLKEEIKPKPSQEGEKPFDFGGLPQRDLKKNLGCG